LRLGVQGVLGVEAYFPLAIHNSQYLRITGNNTDDGVNPLHPLHLN